MLVTFQCKGHPHITLFGDVATRLLQLMGHSGAIPGALLAADVPEALELLKKAVNHLPDAPNPDESTDAVALRHRALPLIQLLDNACQHQEKVMWAAY